ncbi:glycosyltransferase family 4 protein [Marinobacter nauticus]|uniref:glycosyltransferase family 4 protein n=1 Tax=Marinobacter nauticus TaxID=2743 RepID=UPI001C999861|nr:glycosyltransferase family 4 protein [Marinobacter nauticus]MBY5937644.1 glycosyltransferase family 4 protein [Marinobacter nauticus]MBY5954872.1 glycosyltransferase family 4 protein [Marinobacter nauticus]MBY6008665.1 glycosyltransferase family 4 protein [Marinobacter nauticus]
MVRSLRVLVTSTHYLPGYKGGGPIKTIKNLFDSTGHEVGFKLITGDRDLGDDSSYDSVTIGDWNQVGDIPVFYARAGKVGYKEIFNEVYSRDYDLIYLNSFFSFRFSFFPLLVAKALKQKVVLGPRGEFSEGALRLKWLKKQVFINVFKLIGFHRYIVFQASSCFEEEDIRRVLGNHVDVKIAEDIGSQEFVEEIPVRSCETLKAVFVSRISPKKNLLAALKILRTVQSPLTYDIYGPIEDQEYWRECENVISSLPSHLEVRYKGSLDPNEVVRSLQAYDVFFFPTRGENFGHVIAEALCAGLPVVIADTTPWRGLQKHGIGWDIPLNNPKAFSSVLDELAVMSDEEYRALRERVLSWARNKFSQRDAVEANIALFKYAYEKK